MIATGPSPTLASRPASVRASSECGAHRRCVNAERLRRLLETERIDPRAYNLDGSHGDEAYVLGPLPGGWAVFYAERRVEVGRRDFDTEDEACHYLLRLIMRDPTARRSR